MKKQKKLFIDYTDEEIEKYRQAFIKNTLRRASYRWPYRNLAAVAARVGRGIYKCADCGKISTNKEKKLDHINPVVDPLVGFVNWDVYAKRMLPSIKGWQVLCKMCHDEKTKAEREIRKETRRRNKNAKEK